MTREDVKAMLIRHVCDAAPELRNADIDLDSSYQELEIDSLALMTILTEVTKEMKVKIPRERLGDINSLNRLVELLFQAANLPKA